MGERQEAIPDKPKRKAAKTHKSNGVTHGTLQTSATAAAERKATRDDLAERRAAQELFDKEFLRSSGLTLADAGPMDYTLVRTSEVMKGRPGLKHHTEWSVRCGCNDPTGAPYVDSFKKGIAEDEAFRLRDLGQPIGVYALQEKPPHKYGQRFASQLHIGHPKGCGVDWPALNADVTQTWRVTEGEKKGSCLSKYGVPTAVIGGIWNWGKDGKLAPDFDAIQFKGRRVEIIPDTDYQTKEPVRTAVAKFAKLLQERGAEVYRVDLPGPEKGADDYVVKHGIEAFKKLCSNAFHIPRPPTVNDVTPEIPLLDTEAPRRTVPVPVGGMSGINPDTAVNVLVPKFAGRIVEYGGAYYERGLREICVPLMETRARTDAMLRVLGPLKYKLEAKSITRLFDNVIAYAQHGGGLIRAVRFGEDPGDCLSRIALPVKGPLDSWEEFLKRLGAPSAFMAFVWSVFEPRHAGRQMCWLRGDGEDGKTVVSNELIDQLRGAACVLDDERLTGGGKRFSLASAFDKRLIVVPDTKNKNLAMAGLIHQLTGHDSMNVEPKGLPPFTARPNVRVLTYSNPKPRITRSRSNTSRLILNEVAPRDGGCDPEWPARIHTQFPAFLAACRDVYAIACSNHGDIALEPAAQVALDLAIDEDEMLHMVDSLVVRVPGNTVDAQRLFALATTAFPELRNNQKWGDFKTYLREALGVEESKLPHKKGVARQRILKGIALREFGDPKLVAAMKAAGKGPKKDDFL